MFGDSSRRWKDFSAADHLALTADASWEAAKDRGNAAFRRGEYLEAARVYRKAALLAAGVLEGGMLDAFISSLEAWPEGSAQRRFVDNYDVLWHCLVPLLPAPPPRPRVVNLPGGRTMVGRYPNKGAAIAWANRAQAELKAGRAGAALESAKRATEANPEYLKGHHREMAALEALGRRGEAEQIKEEMADYSLARSLYPCEAQALITAGWIDFERAMMVYGPVRFEQAALHVADQDEDEKRVEVRASIVPFQGGQGLMLSLVYGFDGKVDCMDFCMCDNANADMADRPPNGFASPATLRHAPHLIGKFIEDLRGFDLQAVGVMCGQGLTQHVDLVRARLKEGRDGTHPPLDGLVVYAATSTAASEDSGIPPAPMFSSEGAMAALSARMGMGT